MYDLILILFLIVINGFLAMSEIAFVSVKRYKLEEKAKRGSEAAKKALSLLNEPEKFLSAVQIGITLVGILAGAFGGYALAEDLKPYINRIEYLQPYSFEISFAVIVTFITYLSLVIGELVPKSIALNNPEAITLFMAGIMFFLTKAFAPFVWLLSVSTRFIIFLFRIKKSEEPTVSEEELKSLLESGTLHGTFEKEESEMIKKIFSFNDTKVTEIMIPRKEIEWIDISMTNEDILNFLSTHHYSRYIVCENNIDNAAGMLETKDFLLRYNTDKSFDIRSILSEILSVPPSIYSIELFEMFRTHRTKTALIVDEYGGTQGLITLHDLVENIVVDIPEKFEQTEPEIFERKDKTFLVDGSIGINRLSELLQIQFFNKDYKTLGGFLMKQLGKIPETGDVVTYSAFKFEVVDMDGNRVDKVLIEKMNSI